MDPRPRSTKVARRLTRKDLRRLTIVALLLQRRRRRRQAAQEGGG